MYIKEKCTSVYLLGEVWIQILTRGARPPKSPLYMHLGYKSVWWADKRPERLNETLSFTIWRCFMTEVRLQGSSRSQSLYRFQSQHDRWRLLSIVMCFL